MVGPGKALAAGGALVRLLARVGSGVYPQIAGDRKTLATRLAAKRLFARVTQGVRSQIAGL